MMGEVTNRRMAGEDHAVLTVVGGNGNCAKPCADCPWRKDAVGVFPAEAFRHSAPCAYDAAMSMFGCHQSPTEKVRTCAGFLLKGAKHNVGARIAWATGKLGAVSDGGHELFGSYREMAIANGVDPDDPVLAECRGDLW